MKRFTCGTLAVALGAVLMASWAMLPADAQVREADDDALQANPPQGGFGGRLGGGGFGYGGANGLQFFGAAPGFENIPLVESANLAVIVSEKGDRASAYCPRTGEWQTQSLEGEQGAPAFCPVPIVGQNLAVIMTPERIFAFSAIVGKWQSQSIKEGDRLQGPGPAPTISNDMASLAIPDRVFAFSAISGRWAELKIPVGKPSPVAHHARFLSVVHGDVISTFSAHTGKWATINWKQAKTVNWKDQTTTE